MGMVISIRILLCITIFPPRFQKFLCLSNIKLIRPDIHILGVWPHGKLHLGHGNLNMTDFSLSSNVLFVYLNSYNCRNIIRVTEHPYPYHIYLCSQPKLPSKMDTSIKLNANISFQSSQRFKA